MKKSKFIVLLLLFCLQPGFLAAQRAEAIRKDVLNPRLDKVLVWRTVEIGVLPPKTPWRLSIARFG